jgi:hypothetical protein
VWWIGWLRLEFVLFGSVLAISWGLNAFSAVSYYYLLSAGKLNSVTRGSILMASTNVFGGMLGGWLFGGTGFVIGVACAIGGGSLYVIAAANIHLGLRVRDILGYSSIVFGCFALLISLLSAYQAFRRDCTTLELTAIAVLGVFIVLICHLVVGKRYYLKNATSSRIAIGVI